MTKLVAAIAVTSVALSVTLPVWAQTAAADSDGRAQPPANDTEQVGVGHALTAGVASSNRAPIGGVLGYRLLLSPQLQVGVELEGGAVQQGYIAGYPVEGGGAFQATALVQGTVLRNGPLWLDLRAGLGARQYFGAEPRPDHASPLALDTATGVLVDLAIIAHVEAESWLTVRTGIAWPVLMQVAPEVDLDITGALTLAGLGFHLSDRVSITADGSLGGVFGLNGDGNKLYVRGQLGLRWLFDANTRDWRAY